MCNLPLLKVRFLVLFRICFLDQEELSLFNERISRDESLHVSLVNCTYVLMLDVMSNRSNKNLVHSIMKNEGSRWYVHEQYARCVAVSVSVSVLSLISSNLIDPDL